MFRPDQYVDIGHIEHPQLFEGVEHIGKFSRRYRNTCGLR
jgi:hypothetical protein